MAVDIPANIPREPLVQLVVALADDELILGHRDSEWTGHSPILEEDIAFSNIAQDEMGHSLAWFTLHEQLTGKSPDWMGFEREWRDFRCCRFVTYPKGDFAYTVTRQYLFDVAEQVRLGALTKSTVTPIREIAEKILREEGYHLLHSQGLVERLGDATEESHQRMQTAVDQTFPQALGMFEEFEAEDEVVKAGIFPGNRVLRAEWVKIVVPFLRSVTLSIPVTDNNGSFAVQCQADEGGRRGNHTEHLKQLVEDMQAVYRMAPGGSW